MAHSADESDGENDQEQQQGQDRYRGGEAVALPPLPVAAAADEGPVIGPALSVAF